MPDLLEKSPMNRSTRLGLLLFVLGACSTLPREIETLPDQYTIPPASTGALAALAASVSRTAPDGESGFKLLDRNAEGLDL